MLAFCIHTHTSGVRKNQAYISSMDILSAIMKTQLPNGVNNMQNLWVSTSFPDANYHAVCHIMPHTKSGLNFFQSLPTSLAPARWIHRFFSFQSYSVHCLWLWCEILIFNSQKSYDIKGSHPWADLIPTQNSKL